MEHVERICMGLSQMLRVMARAMVAGTQEAVKADEEVGRGERGR